MIGDIKNWLGIEGLKIEIDMPEEWNSENQKVGGKLFLFSKRPQQLQGIEMRLIERYTRGRGKNKLMTDYILGQQNVKINMEIVPEQIYEVNFDLPYSILESEVDRMEDWNFITKYMVNVAKQVKNAHSIYWLEVQAKVDGAAMNPYAKKILLLS